MKLKIITQIIFWILIMYFETQYESIKKRVKYYERKKSTK